MKDRSGRREEGKRIARRSLKGGDPPSGLFFTLGVGGIHRRWERNPVYQRLREMSVL